MSNNKNNQNYVTTIEVGGKTYSKTISSAADIKEIMEDLVLYVQKEGINELGECNLKVIFSNPTSIV